MPDLRDRLHLEMLQGSPNRRRSMPRRLFRAIRQELRSPLVYGDEWGNVDMVEPLRFVRDKWVLPYVDPEHVGLEIGPGGGRWTRYLLPLKQLYAVDYHEELLAELKKTFDRSNMTFIRNSGCDFPGVPDQSVDFLFSFGVFVHLDAELIEEYLGNMRRVLTRSANAVVQYSDKTKLMARQNPKFAENDPDRMRSMVVSAGFEILEEDLTTLWHSSLVRFGHAP